MKDFCLNHLINKIKAKCDYDEDKISIVKYGFESIYILITKTIVIFSIAILFNIFKEVLIFTLLYNIIRMPSFGLHATKSYLCYIFSGLIFIAIPYLCTKIVLNTEFKIILGIIEIFFIYKNAPSDTYKRPIVSKKRRDKFKFISTILAIIMIYSTFFIKNNFICNSIIFSLLVQCIMISPFTYKIFKLPYANYKLYQNMS